jgi:iron complex outermembrane recepter protein
MTMRHAVVRKVGRVTVLGLSVLLTHAWFVPTVAEAAKAQSAKAQKKSATVASPKTSAPVAPTGVVAAALSTPKAAPAATVAAAQAPAAPVSGAPPAAVPVPPASPPAPPTAVPAAPAAVPPNPPGPASADSTAGMPAPGAEAIPPELLVPPPPASGPEAAAGYYDPNAVDVVKVTVDRREQNLQNYAGSASAYTEEDLARVGVTSVREMSQVNPALEIGTQDGNTEIFIRGVGSTNNTELGDPSAATHVNGIYIPRPRGVGSMFFDLERVELNRGPQGTIRGRNATAGSLNIITAKPVLGQFGAEGSIQLGNYAQRLTRAMVNLPLTNTLSLRLASFSENRDPFLSNGGPITTTRASESADTLAYRAGVKWVPVSFITVNIGHDFTREKGTAYTGVNYQPALTSGLLPDEVPDPRKVIYRGPPPSESMQHWGINGEITANLGPVVVNYLGGYRNLTFRQVTGGNIGVSFPGQQIPDAQLDNWSSSWWYSASQSQVHELRIMAPDSARFRWTVGGFLFREKQQVTLLNTADQSNTFAGVEFNMPHVPGASEAGYLDGIFDIFKWLRATGGLRVTHESKERTGLGAVWLINNVNPGGQNFRYGTEGFQPAFGARTLYPVDGVPFDANAVFLNGITRFGARDTLGPLLGPGGPGMVQAGPVIPQNGKYGQTFLDYRAGLDMDLNAQQMVYATFTTGHTSGGFNDNINYTNPATGMLFSVAPTYKPESLYAFEVGSKNELLDRKLRVNVAAFLYLYRDQAFQVIQQTGPQPADITQPPPASAVRVNVGKSHILGLEFDTSYRLPLGLVASVAGLIMDAKFDEGQLFDSRVAFGPTNSPDDRVNIKGHRLPRAPRATLNYSLSQNFQTSIGWFDWIATAQSRSEYFMTVFNGTGTDSQGRVNPALSDVVPSYTRLDLGAGYTRPEGKVRLSVFANNVNNTAYMTTFINQPGLNLRFFNTPRQVGVRLNLYW